MLYESAHVRVAAEYGTATLWLDFPGEPVNALDAARLQEIDSALAVVSRSPFVHILVVRSAKPAGFCAGVHPAALVSLTTGADRAAFAGCGQRVLDRLATLDVVTVAFVDGPCLGAGLEVALACDHRLCLSRPATHLGFPDAARGIPPGFGGTVRLRNQIGRRRAGEMLASGRTLSGREARALGLVDHAFCERRAKIELRTFLDRLEQSGHRPRRRWELAGFAAERRVFARSLAGSPARDAIARQLARLDPIPVESGPVNPIPPFPAVIGVVGEDDVASRIAAEVTLRGGEVIVSGGGSGVFRNIAAARVRGFITPLEADRAGARVRVSRSLDGFDRAGLVLVSDHDSIDELAGVVRPRCVVAHCPSLTPRIRRDADALAALAAWLRPFGFAPSAPAPAGRAELVAA